LKIETRENTATEAFTNIRWKTRYEKYYETTAASKKKINFLDQDDEEELTPLADFLNLECKPSVLKNDFILVKDLVEEYQKYCDQNQ
jgi:hypothetical protein